MQPLPKEFKFPSVYATFPAELFPPLQTKNNSSACQRTETIHDNNKEKMLQGHGAPRPCAGRNKQEKHNEKYTQLQCNRPYRPRQIHPV